MAEGKLDRRGLQKDLRACVASYCSRSLRLRLFGFRFFLIQAIVGSLYKKRQHAESGCKMFVLPFEFGLFTPVKVFSDLTGFDLSKNISNSGVIFLLSKLFCAPPKHALKTAVSLWG